MTEIVYIKTLLTVPYPQFVFPNVILSRSRFGATLMIRFIVLMLLNNLVLSSLIFPYQHCSFVPIDVCFLNLLAIHYTYFLYVVVSTPRFLLEDQRPGGVADAGVFLITTLIALVVLEEFKAHPVATSLQLLHGLKQHPDRMPAADGVVVLSQILPKALRFERFDQVHAHLVQDFDPLVNGTVRVLVVRIPEASSPMAKIGRDDEEILRIRKVRRQDFAVRFLPVVANGADHDWHDGKLVAEAVGFSAKRFELQFIM